MKTEQEIREAMELVRFAAQAETAHQLQLAYLYSGMEWALGESEGIDTLIRKLRATKDILTRASLGIEMDIAAEIASIA
jgi:hypothetical protein